MTHTRIIAADGTRYISESASRVRTKRTIAIICAIIAAPFMVAAAVGIYLGATGAIQAPTVSRTATLHEGDKINIPSYCWVAYDTDDQVNKIHCD